MKLILSIVFGVLASFVNGQESFDVVVISPPNQTTFSISELAEGNVPVTMFTNLQESLLRPLVTVWKGSLTLLLPKNLKKEAAGIFKRSRKPDVRFVHYSDVLDFPMVLSDVEYHAANSEKASKITYAYVRAFGTDEGDFALLDIVVQELKIETVEVFPVYNFNLGMAVLKNGSADVFISEPSVNYGRFKVADFTAFTSQKDLVIMAKYPGKVGVAWKLVLPFGYRTWIATLVAFLAVAATLTIFARKDFPSPINNLILVLAYLLHEPHTLRKMRKDEEWKMAIRWLLVIWLFCSYLLSLSYQSNLLASLVKTSTEDPIDTFQDVLDSDLTLSIPVGTSSTNLMKHNPRKVVRDVYEKNTLAKDGFYNWARPNAMKELAEQVALGTHATVGRRGGFPGYNFRVASDILDNSYSAWACQIGYGRKYEIDKVFLYLQAGGIMQKLMVNEVSNVYEEESEETVLTIGHLFHLWLMSICGLAIASLFLINEKAKNRKNVAKRYEDEGQNGPVRRGRKNIFARMMYDCILHG